MTMMGGQTLSCVRQAWLVLGAKTIQLDSPSSGWACQSLDLGFPVVRAVLSSRPDADGSIDRTQLMGERTITAALTAVDSMPGGSSIDAIATSFAPFMVPSARPVLHYVLDRPGAPERTLTLRAADYGWPIVGPVQRDIALQWIAADPIAKDTVVKTTTAFAGAPGGRTYPWTPPRVFPAGSVSASNGTISGSGDVLIKPLISIYGPISGPWLQFLDNVTHAQTVLTFQASARIDAGHRLDLDCNAHTAWYDGDRTQNMLGQIYWGQSQWPAISPSGAAMLLHGTTATNTTQAVATWQDGYLV